MVHLPLAINVISCKELWPDPQLLKANEIVSYLRRGASAKFLIPGYG